MISSIKKWLVGMALVAVAVLLPQSASAALTLTLDEGLTQGGPFQLTVTGAPGGATVVFVRSTGGPGPGPCPAGIAPLCLDVQSPAAKLGSAPADAAGTAVLNGSLPATVPIGASLSLQAVVGGPAPDSSNVITATIDAPSAVETCRTVGALTWCYHPTECGKACNDTCAAVGLSALADSTTWFEAQDTIDECQTIAAAFGSFEPVSFASYTYACMEDSFGFHTSDGGLNDEDFGLFCSSSSSCPDDHRTNMDQLGVPCGPDSRRSICPCE